MRIRCGHCAKVLINTQALVLAAALWTVPQAVLCCSFVPGERAGRFPKAACEGAFPPLPSPRDSVLPPSQSLSLPACPLHPSGVPTKQVPSVSESQESGHVGFVRTLLAARPLIYLPMLSLPSVFILLSAQDKWLPYSAEHQRLQSS